MLFLGISLNTFAQTVGDAPFQPTGDLSWRANYGKESADIKAVSLSEEEAVFDIKNPKGPEQVRLDVKNKGKDEGEIIARDAKTGEIKSYGAAKKDEYLRIQHNLPGHQANIDMKRTGVGEDDYSGTLKYRSKEENIDLKVNNGKVMGTVQQIENGYEQVIQMYADGSAQLTIKDPKTHKTLFTAQQTSDEYGKVYDATGKLIAEGKEDHMKIYDKKAYKRFEQITDDDDD